MARHPSSYRVGGGSIGKKRGIHVVDKSDWPKLTWRYPLIHNFDFGFGLSAETTLKQSTIVTYMMQNNSIVDFETIKTNPENADFATVAYPDTCAGSYVPTIHVTWVAIIPSVDTEIVHLKFDSMMLHTSMLNRLDAHDKKTGFDIETILELEHATDDETCYPIFNGTKLFETQGVYDTTFKDGFADVGLGTDLQPEGVAFDKEQFFDAMHYFTNKEMLKTVTGKMRSHTLSEPIIPHGKSIVVSSRTMGTPSLCKFQHPYTFCGELFHVPPSGDRTQFHLIGATTAGQEHIQIKGFVRFNEFNPDYNFARA